MEYTDEMQTLIFKTSIDIIIILLLLAVSISLIWIAMFFYYKKNKKTNRKGIKSSFIGSSTLTVICLLFSFATIPSFQTISDMKKDIENHSFVTYVGDYYIEDTYHSTISLSEFWFDLRPVTIENDSEPLWFDRMSNFNVNIKDSGTIVYGKNSRYIVKIENMR
jgi:heme/copper-type cytochrome/quinol oxidase subunit 2